MDSISEQRLSQVHPQLSEKIEAMATALAAEGIIIRVVQGFRTYAEQHALYMQSRTDPPTGPKVTDADEGYSMHNFALAVDCMPSLNGEAGPYKPDPVAGSSRYRAMVAAGEAQGLVSGSAWPSIHDWPHFQMPGLPVTPTDQMRTDFMAGGLPLVWQKFEAGVY